MKRFQDQIERKKDLQSGVEPLGLLVVLLDLGQGPQEVESEASKVEVVLHEARAGEGGHGLEVGHAVLDVDLADAGHARLLVDQLELEGLEVLGQLEVFVVEVLYGFGGKIFVGNV